MASLIVFIVKIHGWYCNFSAEAESRRVLGDSDRQMKPDDFEREARALDKYLQRMLTHPGINKMCIFHLPILIN